MQKELGPKQARWQEFLANFKSEWLYWPRRHTVVINALNQKELTEYVIALSHVISYFNENIKQATKIDSTYEKMKQQVKEGATKKYWVEDDLLVAKRGRLYVPRSCLHKELLRETYDVE